MRGRKPTPSYLRVLRGDTRKQARDQSRPRVLPPPEPIQPPGALSTAAKAVWAELAPELHRVGWLTALDAPAFAALCGVVARWREVDARLAGGEDTPALRRLARDLGRDVTKMGEQFGLTPLARTRLSVVQPKVKSKFSDFLAGADEAESA